MTNRFKRAEMILVMTLFCTAIVGCANNTGYHHAPSRGDTRQSVETVAGNSVSVAVGVAAGMAIFIKMLPILL